MQDDYGNLSSMRNDMPLDSKRTGTEKQYTSVEQDPNREEKDELEESSREDLMKNMRMLGEENDDSSDEDIKKWNLVQIEIIHTLDAR